tara:strand:- start:401 stop:955 length:555 start_codon:yes stop_codon:yes gene_type:complete
MITSSLDKSFFQKTIEPIRLLILRNLRLRQIFFKFMKIDYWGLSVFIVRNIDIKPTVLDNLKEVISKVGFEIIDYRILNKSELSNIINLGPKKWRKSKPFIFIAAFDKKPIPPVSSKIITLMNFYPDIDNVRLLVKHKIRRIINDSLPLEKKGKHFHATDNSYEARQYMDAVDPNLISKLGLKP